MDDYFFGGEDFRVENKTTPKSNMTIKHPRFEDVFSIKKWDILQPVMFFFRV